MYSIAAEARVLFSRGSCTLWQRLVYSITEARVLFSRRSFTLWQRLVHSMAEAHTLIDRGSYCLAVQETRFCMAEAHGVWGVPSFLHPDTRQTSIKISIVNHIFVSS